MAKKKITQELAVAPASGSQGEVLPAQLDVAFGEVMLVDESTNEEDLRSNDLTVLTSMIDMMNKTAIQCTQQAAQVPVDEKCKVAMTMVALIRERQKIFHRVIKNLPPGDGPPGGFRGFTS
jgi:exosome complex RNA-binding protein Rrp42 (RNase PH superfamily)